MDLDSEKFTSRLEIRYVVRADVRIFFRTNEWTSRTTVGKKTLKWPDVRNVSPCDIKCWYMVLLMRNN